MCLVPGSSEPPSLPTAQHCLRILLLVCPDSEEYGKALALSGYVITDATFALLFPEGRRGRFVLLYCGHNLYPETVLNTPDSTADTGLWQHAMFMADRLYFNNVQNRDIYLQECGDS
ncbi:MAG: hypothetical protein ACLVBP_09600 [Ruminococcus sp.]